MPEFPVAEYASRVKKLGELMNRDGLDLLLVSGEENYRYFTGARSLVTWRSFTRPVFAILDGENPPTILTHASLEEPTRSEGFYGDIFSYQEITRSPMEQLSGLLLSKAGRRRKRQKIGFEGGLEQRLGVPFLDFQKLRESRSDSFMLADATDIIWELRKNKSEREIECMREAGGILGRARPRAFSELRSGMTEREAARRVASHMIEEGADEVAFVHVNSGRLHTWYPTDRKLIPGDVVYIDAGAVVKGYCCEYDRLGTVGQPSEAQRDLYELITSINESMRRFVKRGVRCSEVFAECARRYSEARLPTEKWGRAGHGQGLMATELPSIAAHDDTVLSPGSVVSTEPGIINDEGVFVWEDVYAVRSDGVSALSSEPGELNLISI
jgi:Xaa-Pro aminopeptidase